MSFRQKLLKYAARTMGYWQPGSSAYFKAQFGQYDPPTYFYPLERLKNGNLKGLMKMGERRGRAVVKVVHRMEFDYYTRVPDEEVPMFVRAKIQARI